MDGQLQAVRAAARARFLAAQSTPGTGSSASATGGGGAAGGCGGGGGAPGRSIATLRDAGGTGGGAVGVNGIATAAGGARPPGSHGSLARDKAPGQQRPFGALPATLANLPPELLDAPISSLLADAPVEPPPAKRARGGGDDPGTIRVPADRTAAIRELLAKPPPPEVRVMSWNIDGLDEVGGPQATMLRTLSVATDVAKHRPVAVLLQEAIPPVLELLCNKQVLGTAYEIVAPEEARMPYYVVIMLDRKRTRRLGPPATLTFPGSQMGRQLLSVAVELTGEGLPETPPLVLATAHLESTRDAAAERKRQLAASLRRIATIVGQPPAGAPAGTRPVGAAVFGGDLNLRDEEVKMVWRELGCQASAIADVWEFCGQPDQHRWTWDTSANTNTGASYSCKTRFDRLYFLSPGVSDASARGGGKQSAKAKAKGKAKALAAGAGDLPMQKVDAAQSNWTCTGFQLLGKAKVPGLGRFPSDHWGVLTSWTCGHTTGSADASASRPPRPAGPSGPGASGATSAAQAPPSKPAASAAAAAALSRAFASGAAVPAPLPAAPPQGQVAAPARGAAAAPLAPAPAEATAAKVLVAPPARGAATAARAAGPAPGGPAAATTPTTATAPAARRETAGDTAAGSSWGNLGGASRAVIDLD